MIGTIHKVLSSDVRRRIILSLAQRDKYLTELADELGKTPQTLDFHLNILSDLGIVSSELREGKKFFMLKDKKILKYIRSHKPLPQHLHHKPPHEIVADSMQKIMERLDSIEACLKKIEEKM